MKVGISTACLYPMETKLALQTLLEKGFRHFEIFFNTYREIQPDYVRTLKSLLDEYGASVKSIHPFTSGFEGMLLFSNYETRTQMVWSFTNNTFGQPTSWERSCSYSMDSVFIPVAKEIPQATLCLFPAGTIRQSEWSNRCTRKCQWFFESKS